MTKKEGKVIEWGPGGYHTRLPANYDFARSRAIDGRAVGSTACGSGIFAAVLPRWQHGLCRIQGRKVVVIVGDNYMKGSPREIAQELIRVAGEMRAIADEVPAREAALAQAEAEAPEGCFRREGHYNNKVAPARSRLKEAISARAEIASAETMAPLIAQIKVPMRGLTLATGARRPAHDGHRYGVLE